MPASLVRFIPACAGNASLSTMRAMTPRGSSRVCGERELTWYRDIDVGGSSPRVRGTRDWRRAGITFPAVHPRVCGERNVERQLVRAFAGSSPRVRGTQHQLALLDLVLRFIPACAGNATSRPRPCATWPVHPRVCGERSFHLSGIAITTGSSPRVRGTLDTSLEAVCPRRFIPACAGNAHSAGRRQPRPGGSSPRVRGTRFGMAKTPFLHRFIPACAGNARRRCRTSTTSTVHPRVCGERSTTTGRATRKSGSSPRVRGTHRQGKTPTRTVRFIPACAGNAIASTRSTRHEPVHPRVCGERAFADVVGRESDGSSPRVRGTRGR